MHTHTRKGGFLLYFKKNKKLYLFIFQCSFIWDVFFWGGERVRKGRYPLKFLDPRVHCAKDDWSMRVTQLFFAHTVGLRSIKKISVFKAAQVFRDYFAL